MGASVRTKVGEVTWGSPTFCKGYGDGVTVLPAHRREGKDHREPLLKGRVDAG